MGLSKKQVEMHIAGVEKRLSSSQEVRSAGLSLFLPYGRKRGGPSGSARTRKKGNLGTRH